MSAFGESYQLGRVLTRTFEALAANALVLFGFSFLIIVGPTVYFTMTTAGFAGLQPGDLLSSIGSFFTSALLYSLAGAFVQAGIAHALVEYDDEDPATFGEMLVGGMKYFLPMFGLNFIWGLGVGLGLIILIFPGIFLILLWSTTVPVLVAENTGVGGAFTRSGQLTSGHRIEIFITLIIYLLIHVLLTFVLNGFSLGGASEAAKSGIVVTTVLQVISQTFMPVILTSFLVALYQELVLVEEGGGSRGLADVFA